MDQKRSAGTVVDMVSGRIHRHGMAGLVCAAALLATTLGLAPSAPGASGASSSPPTLPQLEADIAASASSFSSPNFARTIPPLGTTGSLEAQPSPVRTACFRQPATFSSLPANLAETCGYGDLAARRTILMWGDSHAAMFASAIDVLGQLLHWHVIAMSMSKCAPWLDPNSVDYFGGSTTDCNRFRSAVIAYANRMHPAAIWPIGLDGYYGRGRFPTASQLATEMARLFAAVRPSRSRIVLIGATPFWPKDPQLCLAAEPNPVKCERSPAALTRANVEAGFTIAASAARIALNDVTPLFCTRSKCPLFVKGPDATRLVFMDQNHIYREYSMWIGAALGQIVGPHL